MAATFARLFCSGLFRSPPKIIQARLCEGPVTNGDRTSNDIGVEGTMNLAISSIWDRADVTTRAMPCSGRSADCGYFGTFPGFMAMCAILSA
jgi:hypothetical protein